MQTKRIRRYNKSKYKYQSYDDLEKLGLGSWLKHNASWVAPIVGIGAGLATAGLAAGPVTAAMAGLGASVGGSVGSSVGGTVTNNAMQDDALNAQNKQTAQQNSYNQVQQQFQNTQIQNPQQSYAPVARCGGRLKRKAVGGPLIDGENTRKLGDDNLIIPQPFIQRPPIFNLLSGDVVSMNEGRNWKSTSGKVATDFSPYYTIKRGKDTYTLTKDEYKKAKDIASDTINNTINQPSFAMGGTLNYEGQSHEGPDGGVPVDSMGNPNSTNPIALVEKGEVMYKGQDGQPYIFSDTLNLGKNKTFAKEAKTIQSRYKMRLGKNMVQKNDNISMKGYQKDMESLQQKQELVRELNGMNQPQPQMRGGGRLPRYRGGSKFTQQQLAPYNQSVSDWNNKTDWENSQMDSLRYVAPVDDSLISNDINNYNASNLGIKPQFTGIGGRSKMYSTPGDFNSANDTRSYSGDFNTGNKDNTNWGVNTGMDNTSLLGLAAPIAGNIIGMIGNNRRRNKGRVTLDTSISTPQNISLERERAALREQGNLARANMRRALKGGTSAQGYMANVGATETGIQRGVGQQLGESLQKEEMYNNQLAQQTAARQDQMKGLKLQTDMYNSQLDAQNAAQQQQYINNMLNSVNQYASERSRAKDRANAYDMMNPDYYTEQEQLPFLQSLYKTPKRRYRVKNPNK